VRGAGGIAVSSTDKLASPFGPQSTEEDRMAGFTFRLEHEDGTPADPPTLHTAVPNWSPGDTIPQRRDGDSSRR
jgi:hypothetical protein